MIICANSEYQIQQTNKEGGETLELTYEAMENHIEKYFGDLPEIDNGGPKAIAMLTRFFSKNIIIRRGEPAILENRELWIKNLCRGAHRYVCFCTFPSGYSIVDEKEKRALVFMREEVRHLESNELQREIRNGVHFEFCLEDGEVKFSDELITRISGKYQMDLLDVRKEKLGKYFCEDIAEIQAKNKTNCEMLTYSQLKTHLEKYLDTLTSFKQIKPESKLILESLLAPEFEMRHLDWPRIRDRKEWVDFICAGDFQYIMHYKKPNGYLVIDDRKKMVGCRVREQIVDMQTGKTVREIINTYHFGFSIVDGQPKFNWGLCTRIPALYQVDRLPDDYWNNY
jgi:hypothetical protein